MTYAGQLQKLKICEHTPTLCLDLGESGKHTHPYFEQGKTKGIKDSLILRRNCGCANLQSLSKAKGR